MWTFQFLCLVQQEVVNLIVWKATNQTQDWYHSLLITYSIFLKINVTGKMQEEQEKAIQTLLFQLRLEWLKLLMKKFMICFSLLELMVIILWMLLLMNGKVLLLMVSIGFQWPININWLISLLMVLKIDLTDQMNSVNWARKQHQSFQLK